ncbi:MAG: glycosyltransferase 87 family protein [Candidatus Limnocylindrales bacterium]
MTTAASPMPAFDAATVTGRPPRPGARRRLLRRAAWAQWRRLHEPRRLLAIGLLGLAGALAVIWLVSRGNLVGADARAYWVGVRAWLDGGDPYHPTGPYLPYVYAPWLLPLFVPWALLPWGVAWFVWSGMNVLLFLWTAEWAYRRHPLATAAVVWVLLLPLIATLDTGNVTLLLALAVWAAQFVGPRLSAALWIIAASMKWFPVLLFVLLPPRARLWGLVAAAVAVLLTLATWPQTLVQLDLAINFPRPLRLDYLLLLWAAVPWFWRHADPLWWLDRHQLPGLLRTARRRVEAVVGGWRRDPEHASAAARREAGSRLRAFFGLS